MGLGTILYNVQPVIHCNLLNITHTACLSIQVDRKNSLCFWGNCILNLFSINRVILVWLNKHRGCPIHGDPHYRRNVRISRNQNLITTANPKCTNTQNQCIQSGVQTNAEFCIKKRSKFIFECSNLITKNIHPGTENAQSCCFILILKHCKLAIQHIKHDIHFGCTP